MDDNYFTLVVISTIVFLILVIFIVVFLLLFQRKQLQNIKDRADLETRFEHEIYKSQVEIQNQTLQTIGKELHDNIGQLLTVAKIHIHVIEDTVQDQKLQKMMSELSELVSTAIHEVRQLTKSLDGDFVRDFGLIEGVRNELKRIDNTGRFKTVFVFPQGGITLGFQKEIILFRIVQEALTNAIKHAAASQLTVCIEEKSGQFSLLIADDGVGFDIGSIQRNSALNSGAGLRNIKNRTTILGGSVEIISEHASGTRITINVPI